MELELSWVSIFIAAAANVIIGMIWYSQNVLGKAWAKEVGLKESDMKKKDGMGPKMLAMLVSSVVMAYVFAHVVAMSAALEMGGGVSTGFWMWLGFIATVIIGAVLWEGKSLKLYAINASYWLVSLLVMGAIIEYVG